MDTEDDDDDDSYDSETDEKRIWEAPAKNYSHMNLKEAVSKERESKLQDDQEEETAEADAKRKLKNAKKRAEKRRKQKEKKIREAVVKEEEEGQKKQQAEIETKQQEIELKLLKEAKIQQRLDLLQLLRGGDLSKVKTFIGDTLDPNTVPSKSVMPSLSLSSSSTPPVPTSKPSNRSTPGTGSVASADMDLMSLLTTNLHAPPHSNNNTGDTSNVSDVPSSRYEMQVRQRMAEQRCHVMRDLIMTQPGTRLHHIFSYITHHSCNIVPSSTYSSDPLLFLHYPHSSISQYTISYNSVLHCCIADAPTNLTNNAASGQGDGTNASSTEGGSQDRFPCILCHPSYFYTLLHLPIIIPLHNPLYRSIMSTYY